MDEGRSAVDYFEYLDKDEDQLVSFTDFLAPTLSIVPPEVAITFISDVRFKMDCLAAIRQCFTVCAKISEAVTVDLIRGKIEDRQDDLVPHMLDAMDMIRFESEPISHAAFEM